MIPDGTDVDRNADLTTQGGKVTIVCNATKVRLIPSGEPGRMLSFPSAPFTIEPATGELFDTQGVMGLCVLDPLSGDIDPQGFTYTATVVPNVGSSWSVTFGGNSVLPDVVDLVRLASITPTTGVSTLEQRIEALEADTGSAVYPVQQVALTGNLAYALPIDAPNDQVVSVVFTQDGTGGHTVTYGGAPVTVDLTAGASTLVEVWPSGAVTYPGKQVDYLSELGDVNVSGSTQGAVLALDGSTWVATSPAVGPRGLPGPAQLSPDPIEPELYDIGEYDYVTSRWTVTPESFGASGDGVTDDTLAIQAAIDYASTIRGTVRFTADEYVVSPLQSHFLPGWPKAVESKYKCLNVKNWVTLDLGTTTLREVPSAALRADPAYPDIATTLLNVNRVHDVRIVGGTVVGDRVARGVPDGNSDGCNSGVVEIYHCENVLVERLVSRDGTGDGFSISDKSRYLNNLTTTAGSPVASCPTSSGVNWAMIASIADGLSLDLIVSSSDAFPVGSVVVAADPVAHTVTLSQAATVTGTTAVLKLKRSRRQNIVLDNCTGDNNRRNGLTVESGRGITIRDCAWINTNGASPEAGIDVEPAVGSDFLEDLTIEGCHTSGNGIAGMYVQTCRDVRVRNCQIWDGLTIRAAADVHVSGNRLSAFVTKHSSAALFNNLLTGKVSIYNDDGNTHGTPLDVVIVNNVFEIPAGSAALNVFNIPNLPTVYRNLIVRGNSFTIWGGEGDASAFGVAATANRVFEKVVFSDNTVSVSYASFTAQTALLFNNFPNSPVGIIKGNSATLRTATAYAGTAVAKLSGVDVLVEGNDFAWSGPTNLSGLHVLDSGTYRMLRNTAKGTVAALISRDAAGPTIHAVGNIAQGATAIATAGILATDSANVLI